MFELTPEEAVEAYDNDNPGDDHEVGVIEVAKAQLAKIPDLDKWMELREQTRGKCKKCKGTGWFVLPGEYPSPETCPACNRSGKGEVRIDRVLVVKERVN